MKWLTITAALILVFTGAASTVQAQTCFIDGDITAVQTNDPSLPAWAYTLTVNWDTGSDATIDHFDLLMDSICGGCTCADFEETLTLMNPTGSVAGVGGCEVPVNASLECAGDPMIPGATGLLLKFTPDETDCSLAPAGTATVVFYSSQDPVAVDEDILSLTDRWGYAACFGHLTGVFPAMACNPVANEAATWGTVKGLFK